MTPATYTHARRCKLSESGAADPVEAIRVVDRRSAR
jgi:hypothetical protein